MGNWAINIQGVGCHHNKALQQDANRMARKFVNDLKAAGHSIERADFTFGAKEDLTNPNDGFAHADDRGGE
jgi:hypothetical protein